MIRAILIFLAVIVFVWWFIKKANQVRETKARVRFAHMKWLLEKSDQCDLKAEEDDSTKTWPVIDWEKRYAELVETVAQRTGQAKGEKK